MEFKFKKRSVGITPLKDIHLPVGQTTAFINYKKHSALQKGMKKLLTKQKVNEGKITALQTQMVSIAQTTLKEIDRLQKDIVDNNKRLRRLGREVIMLMQLDFWHSYWEEYQPIWKEICQNTNIYWQI